MDAHPGEEIAGLRRDRKALILAHNYQRAEIQELSNFVGDSLELSRKAPTIDVGVLVFCGVHFMAETAKILSPEKTMLLPDEEAGCPMAEMITAAQFEAEKVKYPGGQVVCCVNSSAAVKAGSQICCTSANAVRVVESLDVRRPILFVPDQYPGHFAMRKTGQKLDLWPGYYPTHMKITVTEIIKQRLRYPGGEGSCSSGVAAGRDQCGG